MYNHDYDFKSEIIQALRDDIQFHFRETSGEFRDGMCPGCNRKDIYIRKDNPWQVACRHLNCGYKESTRKLYPDIFENLSKKYPATDVDPNASADAYMKIDRGFDLEIIRGMYEQGYRKISEKNFAATVRFPLWDNFYWQRLIDNEKIRENGGKKVHIYCPIEKGGFKDKAWVPPGMEFKKNDQIWITEGIFKTIAFLHIKKKSIAAISANNLPRKIIEANKGKNITWVLAYDNDKAGNTVSRKYSKELDKLGEKYLVAFPRYKSADWDDEFRAGNLNEQYLQEAIWRGYYQLADSSEMKAFLYWAHYRPKKKNGESGTTRLNYFIFNFQNFLFSCKVENDSEEKVNIEEYLKENWSKINKAQFYGILLRDFNNIAEINKISNCYPEFLYEQENIERKTTQYMIKITSGYGNKNRIIELNPKSMLSPKDFSGNLITAGSGFTFDGSPLDLKILKDSWFNRKLKKLEVIDYVGYSREYGVYVFPEFGFKNGKLLKQIDNDYIASDEIKIKTTLSDINVHYNENFDPYWIDDFKTVFHNNGLALMGWWLGSLFAEQVKEKQSTYPWFELTGVPGAGKSTLLRFMWKLCGRNNYEGFDPCKDNPKARDRQMKQVANLPVIFVEGDRENAKYSLDLNEYKNTYDYKGLLRGTAKADYSNETNSFPFRGTLLISQNAQVDSSPAVMERICYFHATKAHYFEGSGEIAEKLKELNIDDMSGFIVKAIKNEKYILSKYFKKYSEVRAFMKAGGIKDSRFILNYSQIATWVWMLQFIFDGKVTDDDCLQAQDFILKRGIEREKRLQSDHPLIEQFWEYYDDLNYVYTREPIKDHNGDIVEESIKTKEILNHSVDDNYIAVNFTHFESVIASNYLQKLNFKDLKKLLPNSKRHKFIECKPVYSAIEHISKRCWIFQKLPKK